MLPLSLKIYKTKNTDSDVVHLDRIKSSVVAVTKEDGPENRNLLKSILESVNISVEEVFLINIPGESTFNINRNLPRDKDFTCIIFGCATEQLGIHIVPKLNSPVRIANFKFMFTHSLKKLGESVSLKKGLWTGLKQIFVDDN